MLIKALILASLIRLLLATQKPFLCSGIYTGVAFVFTLAGGGRFLAALLIGAIVLVLSSIYFWLLQRFEEQTGLFWFIAVAGIFIGLV